MEFLIHIFMNTSEALHDLDGLLGQLLPEVFFASLAHLGGTRDGDRLWLASALDF